LGRDAAGGGREEKRRKGERKTERSKVRQPKQARKGVQGSSVTTPTDPAMSIHLSLYAGAEVPARGGSRRKATRRKMLKTGSCAGLHASAMWFFPEGCCGSFFRGQEEVTTAMSRQNQFVAVFYPHAGRKAWFRKDFSLDKV